MAGKRLMLAAGLTLISLLLTAGCGQNAPVTVSAPGTPTVSAEPAQPSTVSESTAPETAPASAASAAGPSTTAGVNPEELDEFRALLKTEGGDKAALDLLRRLAPDLPADDVSWMFFALEDYQKAAVDEGAIVDYSMYQAIEPYLPPDLAAYIEIMAKESAQRMLEDGLLIVPADEVIVRALACERFMISYGTSQKAQQVSDIYSGYIDAYFYGVEKTPVFDDANRLRQEFLDSYSRFSSESKDSAFVSALTAYLKILSDNGYALNQEVSDARDMLTEPLRLKPCYG
jgi:hypothetical protein